MASQSDHIQATIAQMQQAIVEQERVLADMRETLAALQRTPNYIKGVSLPHSAPTPTVEKVAGTRTLANKNVTALTREWLGNYGKYDTKIDINEIRDDLKRQGVKVKDRSIYSAIHVIVKDECEEGNFNLGYRKGFGFFKSREKVDDPTHEDTELVASR